MASDDVDYQSWFRGLSEDDREAEQTAAQLRDRQSNLDGRLDAQGRLLYGTMGVTSMDDYVVIDGQTYLRGTPFADLSASAQQYGIDWSGRPDPSIYNEEYGVLIPAAYGMAINDAQPSGDDGMPGWFMVAAAFMAAVAAIPSFAATFSGLAAGETLAAVGAETFGTGVIGADGISSLAAGVGEGGLISGANGINAYAASALESGGAWLEGVEGLSAAQQAVADSTTEWLSEFSAPGQTTPFETPYDAPFQEPYEDFARYNLEQAQAPQTTPQEFLEPAEDRLLQPNPQVTPSMPQEFLEPAEDRMLTPNPSGSPSLLPKTPPTGLIDRLLNNDRAIAAGITVAGGALSGLSGNDAASLLKQKAQLDKENAIALRNDTQQRTTANAFRGTLGTRPSANKQLRRPTTDGSLGPLVYGPTGLINSGRRI